MVKKIKFALEMANGIKARTLEDLQENFDLEKAMGYYFDGKLLEWLNDRYYEQEADAIRQLDITAADFKKQFCLALGAPYNEEVLDVESLASLSEKKGKLKKLTADDTILDQAEYTAFNQEDLADLLDAGVETIYLCGTYFAVPVREEKHCYVGILGRPVIRIGAVSLEELSQKEIIFRNVILNHKETKQYVPSPVFSHYISRSEQRKAEQLYRAAQNILGKVAFDDQKIHQV